MRPIPAEWARAPHAFSIDFLTSAGDLCGIILLRLETGCAGSGRHWRGGPYWPPFSIDSGFSGALLLCVPSSGITGQIGRAYSALKNPKPRLGVRVLLEGGVPLYVVPPAISGSELPKEPCLKRAKGSQTWKKYF